MSNIILIFIFFFCLLLGILFRREDPKTPRLHLRKCRAITSESLGFILRGTLIQSIRQLLRYFRLDHNVGPADYQTGGFHQVLQPAWLISQSKRYLMHTWSTCALEDEIISEKMHSLITFKDFSIHLGPELGKEPYADMILYMILCVFSYPINHLLTPLDLSCSPTGVPNCRVETNNRTRYRILHRTSDASYFSKLFCCQRYFNCFVYFNVELL